MIGKTLAHYEISALLGKGGMGEVYRARDTKLKRDVALKVLPADLASDPARLERFQREAEAVAGLNHPHIVTLHTVEEDQGTRFLTMELVEGRGLERIIPPDGLPLAKVFEIGIAVADALAAAHAKGIVHRDLKPANVMVTDDGHVKVLDFGLAKLAEDRAEPSSGSVTQALPITAQGSVLGTVPYMSPEQLRGQDVDHRSDIFSLGILLYELATGRRPFGGATNADVTSSILRETPPVLNQMKPDLPRHLGRVVAHCLEKERKDRYQSALDVRNELRSLRREVDSGSDITTQASMPSAPRAGSGRARWIGGIAAGILVVIVAALMLGRSRTDVPPETGPAVATSQVDPHSIAVLPFVNMTSDPDQEYFSDGIAEELLNLLAKVPELKVTARTSSFAFKGKEVEIPEIARQLGVANVLEGSVRRSGDQVRITVQLIHAADGFNVWSETYDRTFDDIFRIQDEIAARVVGELQIKLLGTKPRTQTTDPEAYATYLRAVHVGRTYNPESLASSRDLFEHALAVDPSYAPAWAGLAKCYIDEFRAGTMSLEEALPRAEEAAQRALSIDPDYAYPLALLGTAANLRNDLSGAAQYLERALALDTVDDQVLNQVGLFLIDLGRLDEAIAVQELIVRRDPLNFDSLYNLTLLQTSVGRFGDAIATGRLAMDLNPERSGAHYGVGIPFLLQGDAAGALAEFEAETSEAWRLLGLPLAYHALGRTAERDGTLAELLAKYGDLAAYNIAAVYSYMGDHDSAFAWLDKELELSGPGVFTEMLAEPLFDNIRSDPRWLPFLTKIGLAPEQISEIEFHMTLAE